MDKKLNTEVQKLMFIVKSRNKSTYGDNIDILDEMSICEIPSGHYVEGELDGKEEKLLGLLKDK